MRKVNLICAAKPYTQLSYPRLAKLYEGACILEREGRSGNFVECGVWEGGSAGVVANVVSNNKDRHIWLLDSWEGLPEPSEWDVDLEGKPGEKGMALGSLDRAKELIFDKLKLDDSVIHFTKGWFDETLPVYKNSIGEISLLHLDCDWYESVKFCLEQLYDSVVDKGFIFIDDYGHWEGCRRAVDEFLKERNLQIELIKIDYTGVYFRK